MLSGPFDAFGDVDVYNRGRKTVKLSKDTIRRAFNNLAEILQRLWGCGGGRERAL